jgi:CubicO group peptidase (beta-lactamase class C family)
MRMHDMMTIDRRKLLGGGAMLGATMLARPAWALSPIPDLGSNAAIGSMFDAFIADDRLPGAVAATALGTGMPVFIARGRQGREGNAAPMTADSLFRVYSMTKPITGIAAMMLVEEGKLDLDQSLGDFFPGFKKPMVALDPEKSLDARPAARPITIRHALTHSGGLGYGIISKGALLKAYVDNGITAGVVSRMKLPEWPDVTPAPSLAVWAERLSHLPLIADPDVRWSYSCGLDLMGAIIEQVTGLDFEAFLYFKLFYPLGMHSSWFQVPQSELGRMTTNYGVSPRGKIPLDPGATTIFSDKPALKLGGSGLVTSPRDYDRFLEMLAGKGMFRTTRIMKEETVRIAMSNLLAPGCDTRGTFIDGQGFGAGGRVHIKADAMGAGVGTYGWGGAASTIAWVDPSRSVRASGFVQYMPDAVYGFGKEFAKTVYSAA